MNFLYLERLLREDLSLSLSRRLDLEGDLDLLLDLLLLDFLLSYFQKLRKFKDFFGGMEISENFLGLTSFT